MVIASKNFIAIDFETANVYRNSACAVGIVRVQGGRIARRAYHLIRPPFRRFDFTEIHGISWAHVRHAPTFVELWPRIAAFFVDVEFVAAHNAAFDAQVLRATCAWYGLRPPDVEFRCTVKIARARWNLHPTKLPNVADFLGLELEHHDASSDALACANIVLRSLTVRRRRTSR